MPDEFLLFQWQPTGESEEVLELIMEELISHRAWKLGLLSLKVFLLFLHPRKSGTFPRVSTWSLSIP